MKLFFKVLLALVVIGIILFLLLFERRAVPDIDWEEEYKLELKDANSLWLFSEMLKLRFGRDNYNEVASDWFEYLEEEEDALLVLIGSELYFDTTSVSQIERFVQSGGEVLLISEILRFRSDSVFIGANFRSVKLDTTYKVLWQDSTTYDISNYDRTLEKRERGLFYHFDSIDSPRISNFEVLAGFEEDEAIFGRVRLGSGQLAIHTVPQFFVNVKALQSSYRTNYNKIFDIFYNKNIIVHNFSRSNLHAGKNQESLLKYILSQRALKWAYYLLLLFALIFLAFSSKRKQKFIKIVPPVKNTSLDYIHTTSDLFMAQGQNQKLVPHMGKVYHRKIARKYFLDSSDPDFVDKLARKSRVSEQLIKKIEKGLANAEHYSFTDEQLINLYNDINSFHKNCK